jgi:hypothetical protein
MIEPGWTGLAATGVAIINTVTINAAAPRIPIHLPSMLCFIAIGVP